MEPRKKHRRMLLKPLHCESGNLSHVETAGNDELDADIEQGHEANTKLTRSLSQSGTCWQTKSGGSGNIVAVRALRGDVHHQLSLIKKMGYPEPRVIPAKMLDRISSLQRARQEWRSMGGMPEQTHVGKVSGRLADWNNRDPLQIEALKTIMVPLGEVASLGASIAFTALERSSIALTPLSESPASVTAALNDFAQQMSASLYFLVPSLASLHDETLCTSSSAAMALYAQCCDMIVTFGPAPGVDAETVACFPDEVLDLRPRLQEKEKNAFGCGPGGVSAEASRRCEKLWEDAEQLLASKPKMKLPKFRTLVCDSVSHQCPDVVEQVPDAESIPCGGDILAKTDLWAQSDVLP